MQDLDPGQGGHGDPAAPPDSMEDPDSSPNSPGVVLVMFLLVVGLVVLFLSL